MPATSPVTSRKHLWKPVRMVMARPRLFICIVFAAIVFFLQPGGWTPVTRLLVSWNVGAWSYLAAVWIMTRGATPQRIRQFALVEDEGQATILTFSVLAASVSLGAIVIELGAVKEMAATVKTPHILLVACTIISAFAFIHTMFALHYAHEYYAEWKAEAKLKPTERGGLTFPGTTTPDYLDFFYFSFVIGVACQTADIAIVSRMMRGLAVIHGTMSFFFNTTVLALTINIAASLI